MPKTCYNCKLPGTECPIGGGSGYACNTKKSEVDWTDMYKEQEIKKEEEKDTNPGLRDRSNRYS